MVGQVGELLSHNVFAYCKNNPIIAKDPSGFRPVYTMDEETDSMREASYERMNGASQVTSRYKSDNQYKGSSTWVREKGTRMKNRAALTISGSFEEAKELTNGRIAYLSGGLIVLGTSTIVGDKKGRKAGIYAGLLLLFTDTFVSKGNINAVAITPFILGKNYLMHTTGVIFENFDNVTNDPNSFNNFHPRGCDR